jgi:sodium pump decarboxylase gamma subunit
MHFEGISGAINVSIVAFSIVFGVLLVLTAMIYAIKVFSGSGDNKPAGGAPAAKGAAAPAKAAPAAAPLQASGSPQAKIVAAITAAIMAMTGGRGRILSIQPAAAGGRPFSTWRASGVVSLVNNRLTRPWNR